MKLGMFTTFSCGICKFPRIASEFDSISPLLFLETVQAWEAGPKAEGRDLWEEDPDHHRDQGHPLRQDWGEASGPAAQALGSSHRGGQPHALKHGGGGPNSPRHVLNHPGALWGPSLNKVSWKAWPITHIGTKTSKPGPTDFWEKWVRGIFGILETPSVYSTPYHGHSQPLKASNWGPKFLEKAGSHCLY